jgi:2,3-bisphosphoglycerate-dependent phosphoglycerate mutase
VEAGLYGHDPDDVRLWRRSWYTVPPLLPENYPRRLEDLQKYINYCGGDPAHVPQGESLKQVANKRIRPFLDQEVVTPPVLQEAALKNNNNNNKNGGTGLVVAHANSLCALLGVICKAEKDPLALAKLEAL